MPLVALTTDFGLTDPFVGLLKAAILARCPVAQIVDLTHAVPAQDIAAGAFWIERSFRYLPRGTVHVCVVDPGVGTARRILLVQRSGQLFLGPDNGLLSPIAAEESSVVREVSPAFLQVAGIGAPSATFQGRDVLAPIAGLLAAGVHRPEEVGPEVSDWLWLDLPEPVVSGGLIHGRILIADHFGNLFSNIDATLLEKREDLSVEVAGERMPLVRTYGDRPAGCLVGLVNAFGVLEVACVGGNAASRLGSGPGDAVTVGATRPRA